MVYGRSAKCWSWTSSFRCDVHDWHIWRFLRYIEAFLRVVHETFSQSRDGEDVLAPAYHSQGGSIKSCKQALLAPCLQVKTSASSRLDRLVCSGLQPCLM